jgi:hypothetical protein
MPTTHDSNFKMPTTHNSNLKNAYNPWQ